MVFNVLIHGRGNTFKTTVCIRMIIEHLKALPDSGIIKNQLLIADAEMNSLGKMKLHPAITGLKEGEFEDLCFQKGFHISYFQPSDPMFTYSYSWVSDFIIPDAINIVLIDGINNTRMSVPEYADLLSAMTERNVYLYTTAHSGVRVEFDGTINSNSKLTIADTSQVVPYMFDKVYQTLDKTRYPTVKTVKGEKSEINKEHWYSPWGPIETTL